MAKQTTIETLTLAQITELGREAANAGDLEMAQDCETVRVSYDRITDDPSEAEHQTLARIVAAINDAAAQRLANAIEHAHAENRGEAEYA